MTLVIGSLTAILHHWSPCSVVESNEEMEEQQRERERKKK